MKRWFGCLGLLCLEDCHAVLRLDLGGAPSFQVLLVWLDQGVFELSAALLANSGTFRPRHFGTEGQVLVIRTAIGNNLRQRVLLAFGAFLEKHLAIREHFRSALLAKIPVGIRLD